MMVFVVVESIMIAGVTLYQFNKQNSEYHKDRLERKEKNLLADIQYEVKKSFDSTLESLSDSTESYEFYSRLIERNDIIITNNYDSADYIFYMMDIKNMQNILLLFIIHYYNNKYMMAWGLPPPAPPAFH